MTFIFDDPVPDIMVVYLMHSILCTCFFGNPVPDSLVTSFYALITCCGLKNDELHILCNENKCCFLLQVL